MSENILPLVPGPYLAEALNTLPNAALAASDTMDATIDVSGIETVRVTARRKQARRGKSSHYFWAANSAVLMAP